MEDFAVIQTHVIVPRRRADIVTRPRLIQLLKDQLDRKLVIVAAPAGYGKTSLLIDFARQSEFPTCWYTLDPLDNDLQRFLAHFLAALEERFPRFGRNSWAALQALGKGQLDVTAFVTTLVNEAYQHISEHFLFVLDDYHLVAENEQINAFLNRFVQDVDENCHLIIASRSLLTLPDLPLLVARNQVSGLSFAELAFDAQEISALFSQNYQLSLSDEAAAQLVEQTEGWVTGVLLSSNLGEQKTADLARVARASGVGLDDFFDQLLQRYDASMQEFLLQTSLMDEFSAELCSQVLGDQADQEPYQQAISTVLRNNTFVLPVDTDDGQLWVRYHHLFSDFLRRRVQDRYPTEALVIQQRLADYYVQTEQAERAFALYQRLGDSQRAIELAERTGPDLLLKGRIDTVAKWLADLPQDAIRSRPALLALHAKIELAHGETERAIGEFEQALGALDAQADPETYARTLLQTASAYLISGDYPHALKLAGQLKTATLENDVAQELHALAEHIEGVALYYSGDREKALAALEASIADYGRSRNPEISVMPLLDMAAIQHELGHFGSAQEEYEAALELLKNQGNTFFVAILYNNLGSLHYLTGEYTSSLDFLEKALDYARLSGNVRTQGYSLLSLTDLLRDTGLFPQAEQSAHEARAVMAQLGDTHLHISLELAEALLANARQAFTSAERHWRNATELARSVESFEEQADSALVGAELALSNGRPGFNRAQLEQAVPFFEEHGQQLEATRASFFLALLAERRGDSGTAQALLESIAWDRLDPDFRASLTALSWRLRSLLREAAGHPDLSALLAPFNQAAEAYSAALPAIQQHLRRQSAHFGTAGSTFRIHALGKSEVEADGHVVTSTDWQADVARRMFFYLIGHPEGVSRETLGLAFWPEASSDEVRYRLKNTLYRIRRATGKDVILFTGEHYRFNADIAHDYDVEHFLGALEQAQSTDQPKAKLAAYEKALKAYRGPYLPNLDDSWAQAERESLARRYRQAMLSLAQLYLKQGHGQQALDLGERLLHDDPYSEETQRLLMRCYAVLGNRAAMARQYERFRARLKEELRADPSTQTQALYEELMRS
jgi:ATP/maltotriose-dependent transcriptional regulator MalT/DNA-binding SARP family transcriptional activator